MLQSVMIDNIIFKPCKFRHIIAHGMFGCTTIDKQGLTDKTHEHLIEGNNFDNIIKRKEYDNYEVYEVKLWKLKKKIWFMTKMV